METLTILRPSTASCQSWASLNRPWMNICLLAFTTEKKIPISTDTMMWYFFCWPKTLNIKKNLSVHTWRKYLMMRHKWWELPGISWISSRKSLLQWCGDMSIFISMNQSRKNYKLIFGISFIQAKRFQSTNSPTINMIIIHFSAWRTRMI